MLLYWDSSAFISWLNEGIDRSEEEMSGIRSVASTVDRGENSLITSVVTQIEVLDDRDGSYAADDFRKFLTARKTKEVMVDPRVAKLASRMRSELRLDDRAMSLPDAIHVATAIYYESSELHTFDAQLLGLNGSHFVQGLRICKPETSQLPLNFPET